MKAIEKVHADIHTLRGAIYTELMRRHAKTPGNIVLQALKDCSEDLYGTGIDHALKAAQSKFHDIDNIADAWDLTWLTALAIKLEHHRKK